MHQSSSPAVCWLTILYTRINYHDYSFTVWRPCVWDSLLGLPDITHDMLSNRLHVCPTSTVTDELTHLRHCTNLCYINIHNNIQQQKQQHKTKSNRWAVSLPDNGELYVPLHIAEALADSAANVSATVAPRASGIRNNSPLYTGFTSHLAAAIIANHVISSHYIFYFKTFFACKLQIFIHIPLVCNT